MEIVPRYKIELARELRQRLTESEARLWQVLRGRKVAEIKFRRQHPIGRFVADFCSESAPKLVIEIDGGYHEELEQKEWDRERASHFTGRGYTVLRVSVESVMTEQSQVIEVIKTTSALLLSETQEPTVIVPPLPPRSGNKGRGAGGEGH